MAAMLIPVTEEKEVQEKQVPREISYFHLNADGTYEDAMCMKASSFIEESQVGLLQNSDIVQCLREAFGPFVGVMHETVPNIITPKTKSTMFVLGAG